jgi:membrane associated rhomboid family serine protease
MGLKEDVKQAITGRNSAVRQLIAINLAVFLLYVIVAVSLFLFGQRELINYVDMYTALPAAWYNALEKPWTLITYFFMHHDPFHIFFNMLMFYWFGMLIEEYLGRIRLFNLYILGGLFGGLMYILAYNLMPGLQDFAKSAILIGASGAVYAVVLGAATLLPDYRFNLFLFGPVKITWIAAAYVIISFASIRSENPGGNIAHLGGALFGFIYISQLRSGNDWGKPLNYIRNTIQHIFFAEPKMTVTRGGNISRFPSKSKSSNAMPSEEDVNLILDKIISSGYDSLTKEEKALLSRAGQNK